MTCNKLILRWIEQSIPGREYLGHLLVDKSLQQGAESLGHICEVAGFQQRVESPGYLLEVGGLQQRAGSPGVLLEVEEPRLRAGQPGSVEAGQINKTIRFNYHKPRYVFIQRQCLDVTWNGLVRRAKYRSR
jgi:hypothetical protein